MVLISTIEVITERNQKSASSAVIRAGIGSALLGPAGLAAGLSAKNKGINTISVHWQDGKQSLIEVSDKTYQTLLTTLY